MGNLERAHWLLLIVKFRFCWWIVVWESLSSWEWQSPQAPGGIHVRRSLCGDFQRGYQLFSRMMGPSVNQGLISNHQILVGTLSLANLHRIIICNTQKKYIWENVSILWSIQVWRCPLGYSENPLIFAMGEVYRYYS